MEFRFETQYSIKALAAASQVLRKTCRRSILTTILKIVLWVYVVVVLPVMLLGSTYAFDAELVLLWVIELFILAILLFQDWVNAWISKKRLLAGMEHLTAVFGEEEYTEAGDSVKSQFGYDRIKNVVENKGFFIIVLGKNHVNVLDIASISGGSAEDFRRFIAAKTGKEVTDIKKVRRN